MTDKIRILPGTGIILAGGSGSRMGFDKTSLPWRGKTLLVHIENIVSSIMAETMIIGFQGNRPPGISDKSLLLAESQKLGPLGGFKLRLESMNHASALVVACDMPFISTEAVETLWKESEGFEATVPQTAEGLHPLFGIYSRSCLPHVETELARGERKFITFFDLVQTKFFDTSERGDYWARILVNLNSPEEYKNALEGDDLR